MKVTVFSVLLMKVTAFSLRTCSQRPYRLTAAAKLVHEDRLRSGCQWNIQTMMKTVHIYSTGSCNGQTREGFARVLIERDNEKRSLIFHYHDKLQNAV